MERGRKRKAAAELGDDGGASKRQRLPDANETPQTVNQIGLQLVEQMKNGKDKSGRSISQLFLTLPDKRELPDYHQVIKLPIAIDTIENKLRRYEYPTLTTVESDVKRMIANAKLYNDEKSEVYGDAERMRKLLSNFMLKHNPAYRDPEYVAFPTPIPDDGGADGLSNYTGKTFQQAQEHLIEDLIDYTDDEGLQIFSPFVNMPPRELTDYYRLIKRPISLNYVKKRTRGQHGRGAATMMTDYKNWDAFEEDVSYIWRNAREYNEDGSDMFNLAGEFEEHFKRRLAQIKEQVEEPQMPKIKLNAPRPKPVLHLGGPKASPTPVASSGVTVDNEALARQKRLVQAGVNGQQTPNPSGLAATLPLHGPGLKFLHWHRKATSSPVAAAEPVKTEKSVAPSPGPSNVRPPSAAPELKPTPAAMMPPPSTVRPPSGSPHPAQPMPVATAAAVPPPATTSHASLHPSVPPTFLDYFSRTKPVADALLPTLTIMTHPQLTILKPFRLDIPASPAYTQQSCTINLPSTHYYLQILPQVSPQLSSGRQYKLFVTVNGVRLMPSAAREMVNGDLNPTGRKQVYEAALNSGVNRIEVEVVAVSGRAGPLEVEKLSIFANLMRA
ncbi:hypothetical protein H2203_004607 [Taxawa tesnikishii (nom. ined.)]|nr:hypothetical protein H2203_004607 [Dothideales sp. JES 119]